MLKNLLVTAAATAVFAGGLVGAAAPALAGPDDGEGCVGFPEIAATYVCVIAVNPGAAVPGTTTTSIPVTVPRFCYAVDCVGPTTVPVPVPGYAPGTGVVAVLWYGGVYYPIAVGSIPAIPDVPDLGEVPSTTDVTEIVWTAIFGSREGWNEFRDEQYDRVCAFGVDLPIC